MHHSLAAFKHRNYRLWFLGQLISLFGSWMQTTAQGFLIYQLTHSSAYLGYVVFASGIPSWMFMLYGGVLADRVSRRTLLLLSQSAMMFFAFVLAGLTFLDIVQPWHILVLSFAVGVAAAFDAPARQAFVLDLVERKDLTNAIALNSTMFNSAAIVGPALAGLTYAAFGPGWCFTVNGISFLAIIAALLAMRIPAGSTRGNRRSPARDIVEGFRYVMQNRTVQTPLLIVAGLSLFGMSFATILPAWAVQVLHGDAKTTGFLQATRGMGAMLGAVSIALIGHIVYKGKLISIGSVVVPIFLVFFSLTRTLPFSLVALAGIGYSTMITLNLCNALLQTKVSDEVRGRVMGIHGLCFFGLMPVGGMLTGFLAHQVGEPLSVAITAICFLATALGILAISPQLKEGESVPVA